jgi:hypothetical protein
VQFLLAGFPPQTANVGRVFAPNRETKKLCSEIALKQPRGNVISKTVASSPSEEPWYLACRANGGRKRLVSDPVYNTQMGDGEVSALLKDYRGSFILTFAASRS